MDAFEKQIIKEYGEGILISASRIEERNNKVISISPAIDVGIGGGIPQGSWVTFSGKEKSGKTTLALQVAAKCQQAGMKVIYGNIEGRLKKMNLSGVKGLDRDAMQVIESKDEKILHGEDFLKIFSAALLHYNEVCLLVDSYSRLVPSKEMNEGIGTSTRGGMGLLLSQFCGQMANVVPVKRHIIMGITQLISNTSGYGASLIERGGSAIKYQVDIKLRVKETKYVPDNAGKNIGQTTKWNIECTALGAPPGGEIVSHIRYGHGIDEVSELIDLGTKLGLLNQAGAWYTCTFMQNHLDLIPAESWSDKVEKQCKTQGAQKMYELLETRKSWRDALQNEVYSLLLGAQP